MLYNIFIVFCAFILISWIIQGMDSAGEGLGIIIVILGAMYFLGVFDKDEPVEVPGVCEVFHNPMSNNGYDTWWW